MTSSGHQAEGESTSQPPERPSRRQHQAPSSPLFPTTTGMSPTLELTASSRPISLSHSSSGSTTSQQLSRPARSPANNQVNLTLGPRSLLSRTSPISGHALWQPWTFPLAVNRHIRSLFSRTTHLPFSSHAPFTHYHISFPRHSRPVFRVARDSAAHPGALEGGTDFGGIWFHISRYKIQINRLTQFAS